MLDTVKDKYYQGWGNHISAIQDLKAQAGFLPDRETGYVTQMGRTPLSIKSQKYVGQNTNSALPALASKPGNNLQETLMNYMGQIQTQKPGTNRVLVRTHTHPTELNLPGKQIDISNIPKVPSPQDFINAASVYAIPQNTDLRYNKNKIYTQEAGKNVRYTYNVSDDIKNRMQTGGDPELLRYMATETLSMIPEQLKATVGAGINTLRGKGNFDELSNQYLNQNLLEKYKRMGYPIMREEF